MKISIILLLIAVTYTVSIKAETNFNTETNILENEGILSKKVHDISSSSSYSQHRFSTRKNGVAARNNDVSGEVLSTENTFSHRHSTSSSHSSGHTTTRVENRKDSVLGNMIIGAILFFAGFPCLWFNEKGYAHTKTFLRKYIKICKEVNSAEIDPNNEDQLICAQGDTVTQDLIIDSTFDLSVNNSIKLQRHCEMYQWVETRTTRRISDDQDEVDYTYTLEWKNEFIESRNYAESYGHENNNGDWLYNGQELYANNVTYGAFKLSESQKRQCVKSEEVPITMNILNIVASKNNYTIANNPIPDSYQSFNNTYNNSYTQPQQNGYYIPGSKTIFVKDGYLYFKREQFRDNAGDFRVKFTKTPCGPITVIGKQSYGCIETFNPAESNKQEEDIDELSSEGCCGCCGLICKACEIINSPISEINWVAEEKCKKKKIFQSKLTQYEIKTWIFRLIGFCCFWIGVYFMLSPVYTLLYWFPLVGRYLGTFGSFICGLVGFLISIPFSLLTISVAWLFYRKEIGIPLLCVALILIGYFTFAYKNDYKGEPQPQF